MAYWNIQEPFSFDKPILRSCENIESVDSTTIDRSMVSLNTSGKKVVPAGLWLVEGRFLPRTRVSELASAGSVEVKVDLQQVLKIGDSIKLLEKKAEVAVGGTFESGDKVYVTYASGSLVFTVEDANTVAQDLTDTINTTNGFGARAVLNGSTVEVYSVLADQLSASTNSDAGTVTAGDYVEQDFIGEIIGINYETSTLTLDTPLATDLTQGTVIGALSGKILGVHIHSIDFTYKPQCIVNAISGSDGIYTQALPYVDSEIISKFPRINFD